MSLGSILSKLTWLQQFYFWREFVWPSSTIVLFQLAPRSENWIIFLFSSNTLNHPIYLPRLVRFFRKGNILISQFLHRLMHMAVCYYKREQNGLGISKTKFWAIKTTKKSFQKPQLKSKPVGKSPVVSCKHLHRGYLNSPTSHHQQMAILLLLY